MSFEHFRAPIEILPYQGENKSIRALCEIFFTDTTRPWELYKASRLQSVLIGKQKGPFLAEFRAYFRAIWLDLFPKLELLKDKKEILWAELLIGHLLAYYTFLDPQESEQLIIPLYVDHKWILGEYELKKISLTPKWMGSQVQAFGLTGKEVPPLLLFKVTSYPLDEGFALQLLADINPLASVGKYLFLLGKKKLRDWFKDKKARVYGMSLGGTLALHATMNFAENIQGAYAYHPASLFPGDIKPAQNVHVVIHHKDIVPMAGFCFGKGWNFYLVKGLIERGFILSHMQCVLAFKEFYWKHKTVICKPFWQYLVAIAHLILSIPLFFLGVLVLFIKNVLIFFNKDEK